MWRVTKFNDPDGAVAKYKKEGHTLVQTIMKFSDRLSGVNFFGPNGITTNGATIQWNIMTGTPGYTSFDIHGARLGVSDDVTAFDPSQTVINPASGPNIYFQLIDPAFPQISGNIVSWEATYDGGTANFDWNSFGVDNDGGDGAGTSTGSYSAGTIGLYNRYVSAQGTKTLGSTWVLTLSIQQN